ncbi:hypothetical protein ACN28S_61515 [Cystobacter fuscus]
MLEREAQTVRTWDAPRRVEGRQSLGTTSQPTPGRSMIPAEDAASDFDSANEKTPSSAVMSR